MQPGRGKFLLQYHHALGSINWFFPDPQLLIFLVLVSVLIFHSIHFVFPSTHYHFVLCTPLKPIETFVTLLLFNCPSLSYERSNIFSQLSFYYSSPDIQLCLNSRLSPVVLLIVDFVYNAGFLI